MLQETKNVYYQIYIFHETNLIQIFSQFALTETVFLIKEQKR